MRTTTACSILLACCALAISCSGDTPASDDVGADTVMQPELVPLDSSEATTDLAVAHDELTPDAPDDPVDIVPQAPLFERGQVIPPDSLACTHFDSGEETLDCNHHGSSVAVTADGTVLIAWYHGIAEKSKDSRIVWSRKLEGVESFGGAEVLFDDPEHAEGNPVIWVHESGALYLFFVTILGGNSWNDGVLRLIRSEDGGESWSDVQTLRDDWGWMTRNKPIRMSNGNLLLPTYDETLYIPSFMISADDFHTEWVEIAFDDDPQGLVDHLSMIQPTVIERDDGTIFSISRNTSSVHSMAYEMTSPDFGATWTAGAISQVPNDSTGIEMTRLKSGRVVLAFNNTLSGRYPLSAALSEDGGQTWPLVTDIDGPCDPPGSCSHGYTSVAQDPSDETIWITFTDERNTIGWVHLNEAWLLEQEGEFVVHSQ